MMRGFEESLAFVACQTASCSVDFVVYTMSDSFRGDDTILSEINKPRVFLISSVDSVATFLPFHVCRSSVTHSINGTVTLSII